ncbi:MAG: PD-(D/E)XK nuclease family protein [Gammaproteobacteria bacterium]|nr:PD-(D/E)XK nuclease family protein [Gammaproteobacteria bacterium]MDA8191386.1 PD-(D/E)XK nuclease family protein [Gammaproteobacteria bacterium]
MPMLKFDEATHTYTLDGKVLPSVTTILRPLQDFSGIPANVLERKRHLGTATHKAIELDLANDLDMESLSEAVQPYFRAWKRFQTDFAPRNAQSEVRVFSKHGYAGTADLVCESRDQKLWVLDFKTSAQIGLATALQTAAYAEAYMDMGWDLRTPQRGAVHLKPDGTYTLHPYTDRKDWPTFLACLTLYHWRTTHDC